MRGVRALKGWACAIIVIAVLALLGIEVIQSESGISSSEQARIQKEEEHSVEYRKIAPFRGVQWKLGYRRAP